MPDDTRISYAAACREAAQTQTERAAHPFRSDDEAFALLASAAALRELATLVERAVVINNGRAPDVHPPWNVAMGLMEAIAAGFTPRPDPEEAR